MDMVNHAAKIDKSVKANDISYANLVKAIHAVQVEMDIYGTTSKEAFGTIQGSMNTFKSAWGNLMPALIQGGDAFDQCVNNLVDSIVGFKDETTGEIKGGLISNLLPATEKALEGVGTLIDRLAPIIAEHFPALAQRLIPPLISGAVKIVQGLIQALPTIVKTVITSIVDIFGEQFPALKGIGDKLVDNAGGIAKALVGIFAAVKIAPAIMKIGGLFGGKGGKGGGFSGLVNTFKELAKADIKTVAKGMANLAIIVGSLGALLWIANKAFSGGVDFTNMLKVISLTGILGLVGAGLSKLTAIIGAIPIMTVVKGIANIAIVMTALGALLFAATKVFADGVNFQQMLEVITLIGIVGTIGSALALLAGIIGLIPIPAVALGIANIAIVLVGITAIIEAFGLLSEIPGFTYFLEKGGEVLVKIFNILGQMVGALAGGVLEGISNSLPKVGENLSAFATALQPMFSAFNGVNMDGVAAFFSAIGAFMLQMAGNNILSFFTGGTDFSGVAEGLNTLATSDGVKNFFNMVNGIEESAFNKGKMLFECLGGISSLPNAGGIAQFFTGDVDYSGVVSGLTTLTSEGVTGFFNMVNAIADEAFNKGKQFFECLDGISSLPNVGGLGQVFSGTNDFQGVASGLAALSNDGVKNFFAMVQGLAPETFDKTKQLFETLGGLDVDNEGGVFNGIGKFFGGDNTEGIKTIGAALEDFGNKTQAFFAQVNALNLNNLNGLWNSLKNADTVTTHVTSIVDEKINGLVTKIGELPKQMGDALRGSGQALADAFVSIWTEAAKQTARPINKLISGANWILQEFGSDKRVAEWTPYAKGTDGHKGGNALVNDGRGAELVQMPNGKIFIPQGKNVFIPNAPKGMKVLPADKTAQLMGKNSPTFRYAKGIGDIDIFEYYDNAAGLVSRLKESVTYNDVSGIALHLSKGLVKTVTNEMTPWVQKLYDEFFTVQYNASAGVEQWRPIVMKALQMEGLLSPANVNLMLYQMQTESSGNPNCVNNWDINAINGTPSKGLMQVIDPTFRAYARPGFDKNIFDPLSNCLAAIRYTVSRYGSLANGWHGHGYANGGIATKPSIFGEKGAEMAIPLSSNKRNRAVSLWRKTGEMLGVDIPYSDTSGEVSATNSYTVENNTYAPVFNLTISGTNDDRATARKVKKWVREAMDETFESMNRRSPKLRTT